MTKLRAALLLLVTVGATALIAACGGGGDGYSSGATAPGTSATTPAAGGGAASAYGNGAIEVTAEDFSFSPGEFEATAGTPVTITLKNQGSATHTLTVYKDEGYAQKVDGADSGRVTGGASATFTTTFASAGDLHFRCEIHPSQMQGEITVR
jgi:plastocyanin